MRPKWKFLGILTFLVPVLIMTYYAVIGGWITKYAVVYLTGQANAAAADDYFTSFITSSTSPVIFTLLFMGVTAAHCHYIRLLTDPAAYRRFRPGTHRMGRIFILSDSEF